MAVTGSAEYVLKFTTQGDAEAAAALKRMGQAEEEQSRIASKIAPSMPAGGTYRGGYSGIQLEAAAPNTAQTGAGIAGAAARAAAASGRAGRMTQAQGEKAIRQQQDRLTKTANRMAREESMGRVLYPRDLINKVQSARAEGTGLESLIPSSLTPKGFVGGKVANSIKGYAESVEAINKEVEGFTEAAKAGNQMASQLERERKNTERADEKEQRDKDREAKRKEQEPERERRRQRSMMNLARAEDRSSLVGRVGRGMTWLLPQQGYYAASAGEALGLSAASVTAIGAMIGTTAIIAAIVSQVMQYTAQNQAVAAQLAGGSGSAPGPADVATANAVRNIGFQMGLNSSDSMKMASQAAQYGLSTADQLAGTVSLGSSIMQRTNLDPTTSGKIAAKIMSDSGASAQQAQRNYDRFTEAIQKSGGSIQIATQDLANFSAVIGKTGDYTGIAALSSYAQSQGLTATQLYGPLLTSTGSQRITQASFLGLTPDQMMQMQQSGTGETKLAQMTAQKFQQMVNQSGFTVAETVAEGMGYVTPGSDADKTFRALLAGGAQGAALRENTATGVGVPSDATMEALHKADITARHAGEGIGPAIGTVLSEFGTSFGEANARMGPSGARLPGQAGFNPLTNLGVGLGFVPDVLGTFIRHLQASSGTGSSTPVGTVTGSLDIHLTTDQGQRGSATVPITPGVRLPNQNINAANSSAPQGGGSIPLPGPAGRI